MLSEFVESLTQFGVIAAIAVVAIVVILVAASGTSFGRWFLPRAVTDVVSKLRPRAQIRDALATDMDEFEVEVTAPAGQPRIVRVRRSEGITFAWTFDTDANFPSNGTFALTIFRHNLRPDSAISPDEWEARIRASLEAVLKPRGFHQGAAETADLQISVFAALEDEVTLSSVDAAFDCHGGHDWAAALSAALQHGNVGETARFARGSLVVDVVDSRSTAMLWHAAAIASIVVDVSLAERERRTLKAIAGMLNHFPPGKEGKRRESTECSSYLKTDPESGP